MNSLHLVLTLSIFFIVNFFLTLGILFYFKNSFSKNNVDDKQNEKLLDLERHLTDLMINQLNNVNTSVTTTTRNINDQIQNFTRETVKVQEFLKQTNSKMEDISSFQDIFKTPKLRGEWGEGQLYHLLSEYYPKELYQEQYLFSNGERADAIFKLPDNKILSIDSKFPLENFKKYMETQNEKERNEYKKVFIGDVKTLIDQIASKYILPSENTVDYALMYIPAEAIYYEIINHLDRDFGIMKYAWSNKIIITSPNTLFLTLRIIEHWYQDTKLSEETHNIIKRLNLIIKDAKTLDDSFRKLGKHLSDTNSAFENSQKRLELMNKKATKLVDFNDKIEEDSKLLNINEE